MQRVAQNCHLLAVEKPLGAAEGGVDSDHSEFRANRPERCQVATRPLLFLRVMTSRRHLLGACLATAGMALFTCAGGSPAFAGDAREVTAAFDAFWAARSPQEARALVPRIVKSGVSFDQALTRFRNGRPYARGVPKG